MKNDPTGPAAEGMPSFSRRQAIKSLAGGAFVGLTDAAIVATTSYAPTEAPAAARDPMGTALVKLHFGDPSVLDWLSEANRERVRELLSLTTQDQRKRLVDLCRADGFERRLSVVRSMPAWEVRGAKALLLMFDLDPSEGRAG